jgi:heme o synthase
LRPTTDTFASASTEASAKEKDAARPHPVEAVAAGARARDYALLLKPRVMSLVVFTGFVGLLLAPGTVDAVSAALTILFIALGAGASGSINMWYDRDIDCRMSRTMNRPLPAGRLAPGSALWLGVALAIASVTGMMVFVNAMAAALLAITIAYYIFIYTFWLKRRTPQNIVIGGASGAFPPMIGWASVTGGIDAGAMVLFAIIFLWTPPHFWALALYRCKDYAKAGVPMLPVVAGFYETKKQILAYSLALVPATFLPLFIGMSGALYGLAAAVLGCVLLYKVRIVWREETEASARNLFFYSIFYLFLIFVALLFDRFFFFPV